MKPLFMVATLGVILWPCATGQGSRISAEVEFARGKEGWTTTGPLPGLRDSSLTVWTDPGEIWHFVSPRGFALASPCLYGGSLSFTMGHSVLMPGQPQQQPSGGGGGRDQRRDKVQPKNPDLYDALLASTKGTTLGVTLGVRAYEEGNYSVSLSAGAWQDAETGGTATGLEVRDVLSSLEAVMLRGSRLGGGRQAEAVWVRRVALSGPDDGSCDEPLPSSPSPSPPPSLKKDDDDATSLGIASKGSKSSAEEEDHSGRRITPPAPERDEKACGELFDARDWKKALSCYEELPPLQGGCWRYLREARLGTMLRKPAVNETIERLRGAIGAGGADGECSAWAHRTRGDVLFRSQEFKDAAKAWREAQVAWEWPRHLSAVLHSDRGAAEHMSGGSEGDVKGEYGMAHSEMPELRVQQVMGTMGTATYKGDARVIIEEKLRSLGGGKAGSPSKWHRDVEEAVRAWCLEKGGGRVSIFARLRGQTMSTADQVWGPSAIERGVGGSEEAAIYLSRELSERGYCVTVYGNPAAEEWGLDASSGVFWYPFYAFHPTETDTDIFVSWRNWDAPWLSSKADQKYLWVHDPLALESDQEYFTQGYLDNLEGIFVLSDYSASQFPPQARPKLIATGNGLAEHLLRDGENRHEVLLYASWPSSGLEEVLKEWSGIRRQVPDAELHVYYGFDMWWATPMYKGQEWFIKWRAEMERLLQQDGVHYFGGVGHIEMADAYARAGFYVYPTETRETAPINLMKSMANGCVPITSRHAMSAIPEFCGEFDLGPDPRPGGIIKADPDWLSDWSSSVVRAIETSKEDMGGMRARMKAYARARFSWDRVADEWAEHFARANQA